MPDRVQDLINHRKVAVACKNYTDKQVKKAKDELITFFSRNTVDTDDHTNELAYQITAPSGAKLLQLQAIGGNTVKLSPSVASDSTKAMIKTMPSTVYTFDGSKFYGDSEVSENLIVLQDLAETTHSSGIKYKVENGIITFDGTSTSSGSLRIPLVNSISSGTYYKISFDSVKGFQLRTASDETIMSSSNGVYTTNDICTTLYYYINTGESYSNSQLKPMLVKGTTAPTEFKVGFNGIHNLELSGLKVEGENLIGLQDVAQTTTNGITYSVKDGVITLNGTTSVNYWAINLSIPTVYAGTYYGTTFATSNPSNSAVYLGTTQSIYGNITTTTSYTNIRIYIHNINTVVNNWVIKPMLVRGSTAPTSFVEYETPITKTIDLTTIVDSNNNKLFPNGKLMGNENVKDVLGVYNQESKWDEVDLGDLNYTYDSGAKRFFSGDLVNIAKPATNNNTIANILNGKYQITYVNYIVGQPDLDMLIALSDGSNLSIRNLSYTDTAQFKTAMSGVMLQFERNTYLTSNTDLSATLRNIQGYSNGSIIAENTNNMDVESVITYNSIIQETLCPSITITRNGVDILTRNLPTQASDGWSAGTQRNYRVFCDDEGNEVSKRETNVDKQDLGSSNYDLTISSARNIFRTHLTTIKSVASQSDIINALSSIYNAVSINATWVDKDMSFWEVNSDYIAFVNNDYNDITTFKTAMTNESLYYELSDTSKTETPMDDFDFFFDVEEGDVITFNNPYAQQVYATYSFLIKEAKSNE